MNKLVIGGGAVVAIILVAAIAVLISPAGGIIISTVVSNAGGRVEPSGKVCGEDIDCVRQLAETCTVGNSVFSKEGIDGFMQIQGQEERGCKVHIRIDKHPEMPAEMISMGMNTATCWFATADIETLDPSTIDVSELDCEGPLYETVKATK